MATRMQQRRGTAAQWISVNSGSGPILAAGEIGFESDTNKFKIGDGVNHWADLTYFTDAASVLAAITELTDGAPDLLNTLNEIAAALSDDPNFFSTVATNLSNHASDTTNIHGIANTALLATISYVDGEINGVAAALPVADGRGLVWNATTDQLDLDLQVLGSGLTFFNDQIITDGTIATINNTNFTGDTNAINIITDNLTVNDTLTGTDLVLSGDLTVNGTTTTVNATNLDITDAMIYIASGNTSNSLDIGVVGAYDDGTYQHTGIVRDATDGKWKIFDGLVAEPGQTIDFANAELGKLQVSAFTAAGAIIGDVTNDEIQRVHGVTSPIQTQINDTHTRIDGVDSTLSANDTRMTAIETSVDAVDLQLVANDTRMTNIETDVASRQFALTTGVGVDIVSNEIVLDYDVVQARVINVSDTEISYLNGLTGGIQEQLDDKASTATVSSTYAPIDNPTFTTAVYLPADTTIGTVTSTELGFVNGVTSSIQTQLDAKATSSNLTSHESATTNVHGIADTADLATQLDITNASASLQANIDDKAPIASPTFTGTVSGITKTMVGLGNADNTADADKPVSTATQTALDAKASLAGATFTGDVSGTNLVLSGDLTVNGTTTTVNTTNFETADPLIYLGEGNSSNSVDLGFISSFNDGLYQHSGLVRDASDGKWKLFKGVIDEPTATVNFSQGSMDSLKVGALEATTVTPSSGIVFSDGTQTVAGTPSLTPINTQTGSITLSSSFVKDSFVQMNVGSGNTITVPTDATYSYPIGASIDFQQMGSGQTSFVAASGVTFQVAKVNGSDALKFRSQFSIATALKTAANTWAIFGDLTN